MSSPTLEDVYIALATYVFRTNCVDAAVLSLALYDYLLNVGFEVEFIWGKRFSWLTLAYILLRYIGLVYVVTSILLNLSVSLPGLVSSCCILHIFQLHSSA